MAKNNGNIIKKVYKIEGGGHHGGAWKVAYADFVTAMMAFFLLMWLLNATEAENLAGLADYFAPTVGVKDEMGIGFRGGKSALSDGIGADKNTNKGVVFGGVPSGPITKVTKKLEENTDEVDSEQIQIIVNQVSTDKKGQGSESSPPSTMTNEDNQKSSSDEEFDEHQKAINATIQDMIQNRRIENGAVEIKRTPEGLLIEIKDINGNSMFKDNSAEMRDNLKIALTELSKIIKNVPNNIAFVGHTSSQPLSGVDANYTKWELSSDRANATRNYLEKNGLQPEQVSRVEGRADNIPFDRRRPESQINNRMDIILLKKSDTPGHKKSVPDSIFMDLQKNIFNKTEEEKVKKPEDNTLKPNKEVIDLLKKSEEFKNMPKLPAQ
ncbi:MAG: flagellar motor protein MotB [Rickettsiales bacterium]|nr:flagellar motor protein MotB [Rickettsiales bacterium]